jgi:hypothetical protein
MKFRKGEISGSEESSGSEEESSGSEDESVDESSGSEDESVDENSGSEDESVDESSGSEEESSGSEEESSVEEQPSTVRFSTTKPHAHCFVVRDTDEVIRVCIRAVFRSPGPQPIHLYQISVQRAPGEEDIGYFSASLLDVRAWIKKNRTQIGLAESPPKRVYKHALLWFVPASQLQRREQAAPCYLAERISDWHAAAYVLGTGGRKESALFGGEAAARFVFGKHARRDGSVHTLAELLTHDCGWVRCSMEVDGVDYTHFKRDDTDAKSLVNRIGDLEKRGYHFGGLSAAADGADSADEDLGGGLSAAVDGADEKVGVSLNLVRRCLSGETDEAYEECSQLPLAYLTAFELFCGRLRELSAASNGSDKRTLRALLCIPEVPEVRLGMSREQRECGTSFPSSLVDGLARYGCTSDGSDARSEAVEQIRRAGLSADRVSDLLVALTAAESLHQADLLVGAYGLAHVPDVTLERLLGREYAGVLNREVFKDRLPLTHRYRLPVVILNHARAIGYLPTPAAFVHRFEDRDRRPDWGLFAEPAQDTDAAAAWQFFRQAQIAVLVIGRVDFEEVRKMVRDDPHTSDLVEAPTHTEDGRERAYELFGYRHRLGRADVRVAVLFSSRRTSIRRLAREVGFEYCGSMLAVLGRYLCGEVADSTGPTEATNPRVLRPPFIQCVAPSSISVKRKLLKRRLGEEVRRAASGSGGLIRHRFECNPEKRTRTDPCVPVLATGSAQAQRLLTECTADWARENSNTEVVCMQQLPVLAFISQYFRPFAVEERTQQRLPRLMLLPNNAGRDQLLEQYNCLIAELHEGMRSLVVNVNAFGVWACPKSSLCAHLL